LSNLKTWEGVKIRQIALIISFYKGGLEIALKMYIPITADGLKSPVLFCHSAIASA
jgi:hypothetical protein